MRLLRSALTMGGALLLLPSTRAALAQPGKQYQAEFALLQTANLIWQGDDDKATAFTFPTLSPGIRVTAWTKTPLIIDLGLTLYSVAADRGFSSDHVILMIEGGVGIDAGRGASRFRPFGGLLGGIISESNGDEEVEPYIGAQVGLRRFFTDYAATRLQVAYRRTIGDVFEIRALEIGAGLGFSI